MEDYRQIWFSQSESGDDLEIRFIGESGLLTVADWFAGDETQLDHIVVTDENGSWELENDQYDNEDAGFDTLFASMHTYESSNGIPTALDSTITGYHTGKWTQV